jgi:hypothetical protein
LAQAGADVVGLVLVEETLVVAREKSKMLDNIRWVAADMRSFKLEEQYYQVMIPGHSFQNINPEGEQVSTLSGIRSQLVADGRLIIHLEDQNHAWLGEIGREKKGGCEPAEEFIHPLTGNGTHTQTAPSLLRTPQTAIVQKIWKELDQNSKIV